MGFKVARNLRIVFEDGDYAGAEIVCRLNVPIGIVMELSRLSTALTALEASAFEDLATRFVDDALVEWNLEEEDGSSVELSQEGFRSLPLPLRQAMIMHWVTKVAEVPVPLGAKSSAGNGSVVPAIPMVALSESPTS